jgi:RND family efflux transporter MFP subunit
MKIRLMAVTILMLAATASVATSASESFSCLMQPNETIKLGSSISGILYQINVEVGDQVKSGQLLAQLESGLQVVELGIAKLRAKSDYEVASARSRLVFQESQVLRVQELHTKKMASEANLDEQNTERDLAAMSVQEARLQSNLKEMEVKRAEELLSLRHITSPVDGLVIDAIMRPGEFVHEQSVVMTVASLNPLIIEAFLPVEYYDRVKEGDIAVIFPDAPVGGSYEASVKNVSQVFDAASGTFSLRLELPNADLSIPGGHRCQLSLPMVVPS